MNKKEYTYDEVWTGIIEFVLELHKHPKYKPKTVKDTQKMLEFIPAIKNVIRTIDNTDKYIEMITMADEVEDVLQKNLKKFQNQYEI